MTITILNVDGAAFADLEQRKSDGAMFDSSTVIGSISSQQFHCLYVCGPVPSEMVQGITINRARMKYNDAIDRGGNSLSVNISIERNGNPAIGTLTNSDITNRTRTVAQTVTAFSDYPVGPGHCLKDITDAIQELFDDFNPSGNKIAMIQFTNSANSTNFIEFGVGGSSEVAIEIDWDAAPLPPSSGGPLRLNSHGKRTGLRVT